MAGILIIWLMYVVQAFRQTVGQGLLTLLVPCYVLYFAFIRSPGARALRLALVIFICGTILL